MKNFIRKILNKYNYDIVNIYYRGSEKYRINFKEPNLNLYDTPTGKYYLPSFLKNDGVANMIKRGFYFDSKIIEIAKQFIKPNSSFLDIGANYGQMTVSLSQHIKSLGNGKVYSFEAEPFIGDILEKNIAINMCDNVNIVLGAVHKFCNMDVIFPEPDFVEFQTYGSYGINPEMKVGRSVKTITIDSLNIQEKISFIKVDIQGCDLFALEGARELILKNKPTIIFEYEEQFQDQFSTTFQDYVEFVNSIHYKFDKTIDSINFLISPK
jgi:FkbM family methyltransferase